MGEENQNQTPNLENSETPNPESVPSDSTQKSALNQDNGEGGLFPNNPKRTEAPVPEKEKPVAKKAPKPQTQPQEVEAIESSGLGGSQIFLIGFLITGGLLVMAFYGALLWALWTGNASNPLFETLGIEASGLKNLLLTLTNLIFGAVALAFLIATLIYIFRWAISRKSDENKRQLMTRFLLFLFFFILACSGWFFLYYIITQMTDARSRSVDNSLITTMPSNVIGLSAPALIEFDIGEKLFKRINPSVIRQISWDFDNDGQTDASGPKVTYRFLDRGANEGRFNVTAEVFYFSSIENAEVSFKSEREVIITNESVVAKINAGPESGPFPLEVEFNAGESKDPDGQVILYEWDMDDDGEFEIRQETPVVTETFARVGEYKVRLRVTGQNNDTDVAEKIITVQTPASDLQAIITSKDPLEGYPPLKITFDGSQSFVKEGLITQFEWFIEGEDEPVLGRKLQRIFRDPGEYKIVLTIQNDLGERQRTEKTIVVLEEDLKPEIVIKTTPELKARQKILRGAVPFEVTFDSSQSTVKDPAEWQWDFDNDGIVDQYGEVTKNVFRETGIYEVKLVIIDSAQGEHEKVFPIEVERAGVVAKVVAEPSAGPAPVTITFDGSGSYTDEGEIVNYIWEFPGQEEPINYGAQIDYLFEKVGNYVVKMTILTSTGKTATTETIVSARAPVVKAEFRVAPTAGPAPLEVKATPAIPKGIVREYVWGFGEATKEPYRVFRADAQRHVYFEPGEYTINLKIVDQNGVISEQKQKVVVK